MKGDAPANINVQVHIESIGDSLNQVRSAVRDYMNAR